MLETATTVTVCGRCTVAMVNCDFTDFDYEGATTDEMASVLSNIEILGNAVHITTGGGTGYFDCFVCDEHVVGRPEIFETEL